ncbi:hypothetical protein M2451_004030 [Dysgonomonas sp. PFB1-18]|uniref:BfmA/BtgA family mobilization protein n=1 Tax=unclassified Dysgonomonas TaxID=2630389 RepID=UPI00247EF7CA|nr:hypothetical protein [Dysgonomonas sp. PF1-14]MDH6340902.1 hypothetical protein [Dysgonomonas sp. PF1-16]MDH6382683.1 hypothetical protein [Dysgonomonas sp. PFB1-18]MDH6399903.1 hypothetical protein [Dysgonomonas sp. PF1-23]
MQNNSRKTIFTTISIDKETALLVDKICKRYSLKKSEVVKLAFRYLYKAHINPADAPESVKSELSKINKRQDDIIRFIRHYEEEKLNSMIRTSHAITVRFEKVVIELYNLVSSEISSSRDLQSNVLKKVSEKFNEHADVINNHAKQINSLSQTQQRNTKKLLKLISLYSELATVE